MIEDEGGKFNLKFIAVFSKPNTSMNKGRRKDPCLTCEFEHCALLD